MGLFFFVGKQIQPLSLCVFLKQFVNKSDKWYILFHIKENKKEIFLNV